MPRPIARPQRPRPRVTVYPRPYALHYPDAAPIPLTSEQAQRLIDLSPIVCAGRYRVIMLDDAARQLYTLRPATLGGGPAFDVARPHTPTPTRERR